MFIDKALVAFSEKCPKDFEFRTRQGKSCSNDTEPMWVLLSYRRSMARRVEFGSVGAATAKTDENEVAERRFQSDLAANRYPSPEF